MPLSTYEDQPSDSGSPAGRWAPALVATVGVVMACFAGEWLVLSSGVAAILLGGMTLFGVRLMTRDKDGGVTNMLGEQAPLVAEVLPVWSRQIESAKQHSEESTSSILSSFGSISERLDQAVQVTQGHAAGLTDAGVDEVLAHSQDAVNALMEPLQQSMEARREAYRRLDELNVEVAGLRQTATQIRQLARRTNMVALNASVEASRAGVQGSGFAVVAQEVRQLSNQSGSAANQMMSRVTALDETLQSLRIKTAGFDDSDESLRLLVDQRARAVISTLLSSLNDLNRSSRDLQETGVLVRDEVERVLMNFQMQDRLSQILTCVMEDMARMGAHLQQGGDLSMTKAGEWLAQLDASYTMEEQRSQHHGNTTIQRETGIEFF